jgi:hypothetical protein
MKNLFTFIGLVYFFINSAYSQIREERLGVLVTHETWRLKTGESLGMSQLGIQTQLKRDYRIGFSTFAATTGQRGGFIVLGGNLERVFRLNNEFEMEIGAYLGGGGGRGGAELTGGGLMLRQNIGLNYSLSKQETLSLGVSRVDFPQRDMIGSYQTYLGYRHSFSALYRPGHEPLSSNPLPNFLANYRFFRHQIGATYQYLSAKDSKTDSGVQQEDFGKLGVSWRTYLDHNWFLQLSSSGAIQGNSRGYMDIVPALGLESVLHRRLAQYVSLGIGAGGGGDVGTGGGVLIEPSLGLQYFFLPKWFLDGSVSRLIASNGDLNATSINFKVGYEIGRKGEEAFANADIFKDYPLRLRVVNQRYSKGSDNWRSEPDRPVSNVGAQIDYFYGPNGYLTGQGLGAYSGGAGAYMVGKFGPGFLYRFSPLFFVQSEALIGAAGGGGIFTGSGLVGQVNFAFGFQLTKDISIQLGSGRIRSMNGTLEANVLEFSLGHQFTGYSK